MCLNGVLQARSEFCRKQQEVDGAGCPVAQRRGRGQQGLCSLLTFLGAAFRHKQESESAGGPRPALCPSIGHVVKRKNSSQISLSPRQRCQQLSKKKGMWHRRNHMPHHPQTQAHKAPSAINIRGRSCRNACLQPDARRPPPSAPADSGCRSRASSRSSPARAPCPAAARGCRRSGP